MLLSLKQLVMAILGGILFAGWVQEFLIFSLQMIAYYSIEQLLRSVHIFNVFWHGMKLHLGNRLILIRPRHFLVGILLRRFRKS